MAKDRTEDESVARNAAQFATTHWSVVLAAGDSASPRSQEALEKLCRQYWFPLYAFVRRAGNSQEDSEDLIQGFFLYVLERHVIDKAKRESGRFRSFMLGCLKNYLAQQHDWEQAEKRGGRRQLLSLDSMDAEARFLNEATAEVTPEKLYDQKWGVTVMAQSLEVVQSAYSRAGQADLLERLHPFLQGENPGMSYREIGADLGMTDAAVRMAVTRLRRRYREALRRAVAETVSEPKDIDAELRYLIQVQTL